MHTVSVHYYIQLVTCNDFLKMKNKMMKKMEKKNHQEQHQYVEKVREKRECMHASILNNLLFKDKLISVRVELPITYMLQSTNNKYVY